MGMVSGELASGPSKAIETWASGSLSKRIRTSLPVNIETDVGAAITSPGDADLVADTGELAHELTSISLDMIS